jgi:hypothetical protein
VVVEVSPSILPLPSPVRSAKFFNIAIDKPSISSNRMCAVIFEVISLGRDHSMLNELLTLSLLICIDEDIGIHYHGVVNEDFSTVLVQAM